MPIEYNPTYESVVLHENHFWFHQADISTRKKFLSAAQFKWNKKLLLSSFVEFQKFIIKKKPTHIHIDLCFQVLFNAVSEQESEKYTAKNKGTCDISQYGVLIVGVQKKILALSLGIK